MKEREERLDAELRELFSERAWYKPYGLNENNARYYHHKFKLGKLTLEMKLKVLFIVGRVGVV